jgi:hypothetical protein
VAMTCRMKVPKMDEYFFDRNRPHSWRKNGSILRHDWKSKFGSKLRSKFHNLVWIWTTHYKYFPRSLHILHQFGTKNFHALVISWWGWTYRSSTSKSFLVGFYRAKAWEDFLLRT